MMFSMNLHTLLSMAEALSKMKLPFLTLLQYVKQFQYSATKRNPKDILKFQRGLQLKNVDHRCNF